MLWCAVALERRPRSVQAALSDRRQPFWFSSQLWEVAINTALNKPGFRMDAARLLREGFLQCAIEAEHCLAVQHLPWIHRDPFDRLLVAQAQARSFTLLTCDRALTDYGAAVRWAGRPGP